MSVFKFPLALVFAVFVSGCATPGGPSLVLPQDQPIQIKFSSDAPTLRVGVLPSIGAGVIVELLNQSIRHDNQLNSARISEIAQSRQRSEPLERLFEAEVRRHFLEKGGKLSEHGSTISVTLDNLTAAYLATSFVGTFKATAFVYVSASNDPPTVGNRAGATVRHIEAEASSRYSVFSSQALFENPDKAYDGLREAILVLAQNVAGQLVLAQRGGNRR